MRSIIQIIIITFIASTLGPIGILSATILPVPANPPQTNIIAPIISDMDESIAIRRRSVAGAIGLSFQEISSARARINAANIDEKSNLWTVRETILEWLSSEEDYFKKAEMRLNADNLTLEEVKNIATDIKKHRSDTYDNNLANALDFIFALEVSRLTDVANDRWHRINTDIQRIERVGLIRRNLFVAEMTKARTMIDGARALVQRALLLAESIYIPQAQIIQNENPQAPTNLTTTEDVVGESETIKEDKPSIRELCEAAIVNLRLGYGEFARISSTVRRIIRAGR